ncbi:hypothetical protein ACWDCC_42000 [Streptomyces sp. NPDC001102]
MKRLAALLLALVAAVGLMVKAPQPAAADDWIGGGTSIACKVGAGPVLGTAIEIGGKISGHDLCDELGKVVSEKLKKAWKNVWDSVLGDVIHSAQDATKWTLKKVLTVALLGPSLDLKATGLFGKDATLAGMLTWLGLVIAAFGAIWQIGRSALTGQTKHVGRAARGWAENLIVSAVGVGLVASLVAAGDALTSGLVNATFADEGDFYDRIVAVMVPVGVSNPITALSIVAVLLLIGFVQMVMVFLRQSAIPIQCLLLPIAGGGRAGGDATQKWLPRLITSICVVITYKPILAVIICTGFAEFGHSKTLAEWLRGCATLLLAVLAPGPLTKLFAPFGEAVGSGMAAGGAMGGIAGAAGYFAGKVGSDGGDGGGAQPATPMEHANYVSQSMSQGGQGGEGGKGNDAQAQASRNDASSRVPGQAAGEGAAADAATAGAGASTGQAGAGAAAGAGGAASAAPAVGIGLQVLDGVNNAVQGASSQIGQGGNSQ